MLKIILFTFGVITVFPMISYAYIGPGLGIGTIGVVLGVLLSMFMALLAILWYPFKRLIKKIKRRESTMDESKKDSDSL